MSQSTVSRTFRAQGLVTDDARRKVIEAAQTLGYRPHALARSLVTGRSRIIGVVTSHEYRSYFGDMLAELCGLLQPRGYHVLSFVAPETIADSTSIMRDILDYRVDGVVVASIDLSSDLAAACRRAGIPVVLYNRHQTDNMAVAVTTDGRAAGQKAAELLLRKGHRRLSIIVGRPGSSTSEDREAGFLAGLAAGGATLFSRAVGHFTPEGAAAAARQILAGGGPDRPDGMFAISDEMAIEVMEIARYSLGLRIPEDLSVIGHDNIAAASLPSFALTTFDLPTLSMLEVVVNELQAQIDGASAGPRRILFQSELVERQSVADRR